MVSSFLWISSIEFLTLVKNSETGFVIGKIWTNPGKRIASIGKLPRPEEFSKALYIFDIGHNDLASGFQYTSYEQVVASLPYILGNLSQAIQVCHCDVNKTKKCYRNAVY